MPQAAAKVRELENSRDLLQHRVNEALLEARTATQEAAEARERKLEVEDALARMTQTQSKQEQELVQCVFCLRLFASPTTMGPWVAAA